jgi:uroporphyrinogen decarboxylase
MNSLERCLAAMNHQKPDRIPVIPQAAQVFARLAGYDFAEYARDPKKIANAHIEGIERFGFDGTVICGADTAILAEACGVPTEYSPAYGPRLSGHLLEKLEDVRKLKVVDPWKDGRLRNWIEAVRIVLEKMGDQYYIIARADQGAFSLACLLRGIENAMLDFATNEQPELLHELLRYCNACIIEFIKALKSVGAPVVTSGDGLSGTSVVSPKIYMQYALPYQIELAQATKKIGVPLAIHICGNTDKIFEQWVTTQAEMFEIDHKTNFQRARQLTVGKICLLGNLDCSGVLFEGTPELIEAKAKEVIDICLPDNGGFILSSGCLIGANTPPENMQALADSAKKYGVYQRAD